MTEEVTFYLQQVTVIELLAMYVRTVEYT